MAGSYTGVSFLSFKMKCQRFLPSYHIKISPNSKKEKKCANAMPLNTDFNSFLKYIMFEMHFLNSSSSFYYFYRLKFLNKCSTTKYLMQTNIFLEISSNLFYIILYDFKNYLHT